MLGLSSGGGLRAPHPSPDPGNPSKRGTECVLRWGRCYHQCTTGQSNGSREDGGKALGAGHIPRGLLGKGGVHGCVPVHCPQGWGGERGRNAWDRATKLLGCQGEELALHPKGSRDPWQNLEQERGLHMGEEEHGMLPRQPRYGSTCFIPPPHHPETTCVRAFSGPHTFKRHSLETQENIWPQPVY